MTGVVACVCTHVVRQALRLVEPRQPRLQSRQGLRADGPSRRLTFELRAQCSLRLRGLGLDPLGLGFHLRLQSAPLSLCRLAKPLLPLEHRAVLLLELLAQRAPRRLGFAAQLLVAAQKQLHHRHRERAAPALRAE